MNYPWQNLFHIDTNGKTIPYQAPSNNGVKGTGFINLKQNPADIESIPEIREYPELLTTLEAINGKGTSVFSIGCHGEKIQKGNEYNSSGYLEFAINDQTLVADANCYFSLFFNFHNQLLQTGFSHPVQFEWVIMPAAFTDIGIQGFTCSIKINSAFYPTPPPSKHAWISALSLVSSFLAHVNLADSRHTHLNPVDKNPDEGKPIY